MCIVCGSGSEHLLRAIVGRHALARPRASGKLIARGVAPAVIPALDPMSLAELAGPADVILRGGPILTMRSDEPMADAIALRAGRIQAVGSEAAALAHRGRLTRIIDLHGRALLPGFVNAHWHMPFTLLCDWVDASNAITAGAVLSATAKAQAATLPGEWIVMSLSADTARQLSGAPGALADVAPLHPTVFTDPDGNIAGGNVLARASGQALPKHVSGLLNRFAARLAVSPAPLRARLVDLLRQTAAAGVTCLRICGLGSLAGAGDLDLMRDVMSDAPRLRLRATLDAALLPAWRDLQLNPGFGDDIFRVDTVSAWLDDAADAAERMTAQLANARQAGWRITLHASGGAQLQSALHCYAALRRRGGPFDERSGVECRQVPTPRQTRRLRQLRLSLGLGSGESDPLPPTDDPRDVALSLGLDAAAGPSPPLAMVRFAVGRGLALPRALAAVTANAARRCGAGDIVGTLQRGKYADLAFLDRDPTAPTTGLLPARCVATWLNGQEVFRA